MDKIFTPKRSLTDSARRRAKSVPITPRDRNRLLTLRQDPSVASLLNHYDDKGCLDSAIFSNTPTSAPREGRVQRRRTGSTLRQLLGNPSSPDLRDASADISWADKFLGSVFLYSNMPHTHDNATSRESDENSSLSSEPITPADPRFTDAHLSEADDSIFSTDGDYRTFSSLEVELSISTDQAHHQVHDRSMTPQKASEVFGFLAERKKTPEPPLPSRLPQLKSPSRFPPEFPHDSYDISRRHSAHIPRMVSPPSHRRSSTISSPTKTNPAGLTTGQNQLRGDEYRSRPLPIVTENHTGQAGRGPHGPRTLQKMVPPVSGIDGPGNILVSPSGGAARPVLSEKSNARAMYPSPACTPAAKSQIPKLRTASGSTVKSVDPKESEIHARQATLPALALPTPKAIAQPPVISVETPGNEKENNVVSRLPQPVTPVRPPGFRLSYIIDPPSPTSSAELSPLAKQLMANLRQQRMLARQKDRQVGRLGSGQSRIRY